MTPIERAYQSLRGTWVGDCFGSHFEFWSIDLSYPKRAAEKRDLPDAIWRYTDDTQMALSVYNSLWKDGDINPDTLAQSFIEHFDIDRGYGTGTEVFLADLAQDGHHLWRQRAFRRFDGNGSYGNGSAMRVAPIGAYFADNMQAVVENARNSSIVTHTHSDAVAGAIAVAVASAVTTNWQNSVDVAQYWSPILEFTPTGALHDRLQQVSQIHKEESVFHVAKQVGCGWDVSAIDTVRFALWCAVHYIDNFTEALWQNISVGGDADTTGAIVGGIVANYSPLPEAWLQRCEPLPNWITP